MPKPTVGRIVHYVSYGTPGGEYTSQCRAAIIAGVPEGALPPVLEGGDMSWSSDDVVVDLVVLNPTGLFFNRCPQNEVNKRGGTWHWPERDPLHGDSDQQSLIPPPTETDWIKSEK